MIGAARVVLAVVPFAVWVALAATAAGWRTVGGLALGWWLSWLAAHASREGIARFAGIAAVGCAIGVMWVAVRSLMDPPWWGLPLLLAVPAVLWWHAIWTHLPAPERDRTEDELDVDDGPPRRAIIVRDANEAGVDIGGIDSSFDYPDDEHHPRTPPPGWVPRSMVTGAAPVVGVFTDDEDEAGLTDPATDLAGRILAAWDGTKSVMHLDELAERMDRDKTILTLDLEEAGVPVEQRVGKKVAGRSVTKAGVRREAFDEWRQSLTTS